MEIVLRVVAVIVTAFGGIMLALAITRNHLPHAIVVSGTVLIVGVGISFLMQVREIARELGGRK